MHIGCPLQIHVIINVDVHVYGLGLTLCVKVNNIYENLFTFQVSVTGPHAYIHVSV